MAALHPALLGRPLGVAVVGHGRWGRNHARVASSADGVRLVGVVEPEASGRREAAARYGTQGWPTLAEALADDQVEAVVIAAPAATHAALAVEALNAGRHVLVEKPAGMSVSEALTMTEHARRAGVQVSAGHTFLYAQPIRNVATWLGKTDRGRPWLIRSERLGGRRREDCDVLWNLAPHDVSILLHLADEPVVRVSARGHVFPGGCRWDLATVEVDFASGLRGEVYVGWRHPGAKRSLRLLGENWAVRYRHGAPGGDTLQLEGAEDELLVAGCERAAHGALGTYREPLLVQLEEFASACRHGHPTVTGPAHFLAVTRVLQAASRSAAAEGKPEDVDNDGAAEPPALQPRI